MTLPAYYCHRDILERRSWCRSQTGRSNWIPIGQTGWCRHSNGTTGTSRAFLISPRIVGPGSPRRSASRASRSRCRAAARACSLAWRGVIRPGTANLPPPPRCRPRVGDTWRQSRLNKNCCGNTVVDSAYAAQCRAAPRREPHRPQAGRQPRATTTITDVASPAPISRYQNKPRAHPGLAQKG
jgi:hypothetical protein